MVGRSMKRGYTKRQNTKRRNTKRRNTKRRSTKLRNKKNKTKRKMRGGTGRVWGENAPRRNAKFRARKWKEERDRKHREKARDPQPVAASPMPNSAATGSQPAATPSPSTFNKSPFELWGSKQLILSTNEYGFIEDIKYNAKSFGDNIIFPGIESCNGIIVVLIDEILNKETIFGYHRPSHVGDMIKHTNNDNKFLELIKNNIENSKNLVFFVVSLGFDSINEVISEIKSEISENLSIPNLERNESYKINENLQGVKFEQRLVETITLTADWRTKHEDTNCSVIFSPIKFRDYGWIIKQGKKTAQIKLS